MDECNKFYGIPLFGYLIIDVTMKHMIRHLLLPLLIAGFLPAGGQTRPDTLAFPCLQKAERLLDEALTFMEKNYYRKEEISWPDLEARAQTTASCGRELRRCVCLDHLVFQTPERAP